MKRPDLDTFACINPACPLFRQRGHSHLVVRKVYGREAIRLWRCRTCYAALSERHGTALFNPKVSEAKAIDVIEPHGQATPRPLYGTSAIAPRSMASQPGHRPASPDRSCRLLTCSSRGTHNVRTENVANVLHASFDLSPHFFICEWTALFSQSIKQRLGFLQVSRVKTLGKPLVHRCQQVIPFLVLVLLVPQTSQAHGGPEFERFGLLLTSYVDGVLEIRRCRGGMLRSGEQAQMASQAIQLRCPEALFGGL
jgi:hypothetical protein